MKMGCSAALSFTDHDQLMKETGARAPLAGVASRHLRARLQSVSYGPALCTSTSTSVDRSIDGQESVQVEKMNVYDCT